MKGKPLLSLNEKEKDGMRENSWFLEISLEDRTKQGCEKESVSLESSFETFFTWMSG